MLFMNILQSKKYNRMLLEHLLKDPKSKGKFADGKKNHWVSYDCWKGKDYSVVFF